VPVVPFFQYSRTYAWRKVKSVPIDSKIFSKKEGLLTTGAVYKS